MIQLVIDCQWIYYSKKHRMKVHYKLKEKNYFIKDMKKLIKFLYQNNNYGKINKLKRDNKKVSLIYRIRIHSKNNMI